MSEVDRILSMTAEEQVADFRANPDTAAWILEPDDAPLTPDDEGPSWREWRQMRDAAWELADLQERVEL